MAIDTETKRRATLGVWAATRILPVADGSIDKPDREHLWLYSGIEVGAAGPGPGAGLELDLLRRHRRKYWPIEKPA